MSQENPFQILNDVPAVVSAVGAKCPGPWGLYPPPDGHQPDHAGVGDGGEEGEALLLHHEALVLLPVGHAGTRVRPGVRHPVQPARADLQPEQQDQAHRQDQQLRRPVCGNLKVFP